MQMKLLEVTNEFVSLTFGFEWEFRASPVVRNVLIIKLLFYHEIILDHYNQNNCDQIIMIIAIIYWTIITSNKSLINQLSLKKIR